MLTYDEGNVGSMGTYVGNDGNVYSAEQQDSIPEGVSIVDHPIATTVNGEDALVGEKGPEIVIGRKTTAAMMQNAPELMNALVRYDKTRSLSSFGGNGNRRLFDEGNVSEATGTDSTEDAQTEQTSQLNDTLTQMQALLQHLITNGVQSNINMYGRDGLHSKLQQANAFMKGK